MKISLVSTVFNEIERLDRTIAGLMAQTIQPSEIIITDAGSKDGTWERLQNWSRESTVPVILLHEKGCNVARGRNLAIEAASGDIIVSTDFGCSHDPEWLASLLTPFREPNGPDVVGGNYSVVEEHINSLPARAVYILEGGYRFRTDQYFTVTSRSIAYRKKVWEELGGYPEWLTLASDDSTFWKLIKKKGYNYRLVDEPHVFWDRHTSLKAYRKEAGRYGRGDGESRTNYRNLWSHVVETSLRYLFFISFPILLILCLTGTLSPFFLLLLILFLPGFRSYLNAFIRWRKLRSPKYHAGILLYSFFVTENLRIAYIRAYLKALWGRSEKQKRESKQLKEILDR